MGDSIFRGLEIARKAKNNILDVPMRRAELQIMKRHRLVCSQIKSGTTLFLNFFAAHNSLKYNFPEPFDILDMENFGSFRLNRDNYKRSISIAHKLQAMGLPLIFHTHNHKRLPRGVFINSPVILLTRERYDWIDSAVHFKFLQRDKQVSKEAAIRFCVNRYSATESTFNEIMASNSNACLLNFETLFDVGTLLQALNTLGVESNTDLVTKAMDMVSIEKVKDAEERLGKPLIVPANFKGNSFISPRRFNKSGFCSEDWRLIDRLFREKK